MYLWVIQILELLDTSSKNDMIYVLKKGGDMIDDS